MSSYIILRTTLFALSIPTLIFVSRPAAVQAQPSDKAVQTQAAPALNGKSLEYGLWHELVMPNETISIFAPRGIEAYVDGNIVSKAWTAPSVSGNHSLTYKDANGRILHQVTLFVLTPSTQIDKRGYIGKYRIGFYPKDTPKGFIRLDADELSLPVSPRFTVGQFLCKQQPKAWPKYLLVSQDNLVRLETLIDSVNLENISQAQDLYVMSGYRTPFYNAAIGSAKYSRHMYGDAADVYFDFDPKDGNMDDLQGDGKVTKADANFLYDHAQDLFAKSPVEKGGLGSYRANAVHGPFIHVDARGYKARWGR